jgi:uncharacterized metal-binding protein
MQVNSSRKRCELIYRVSGASDRSRRLALLVAFRRFIVVCCVVAVGVMVALLVEASIGVDLADVVDESSRSHLRLYKTGLCT